MNENPNRAKVCNICGGSTYRRVHHFKGRKLGREPVREVSVIQCRACGVRRRMPTITDEYEKEYHAPYIEQGQAIHPHQLSHFADLMMARFALFTTACASINGAGLAFDSGSQYGYADERYPLESLLGCSAAFAPAAHYPAKETLGAGIYMASRNGAAPGL